MAQDAKTDTPSPPKRGAGWWLYLVLGLVVLQVAFRLMIELRPGALGLVAWYFGAGLVPLGAWLLLAVGEIGSLVRRPFWSRPRALGFLVLIGLGLSDQLYQTYPSS